MASIEDVARLAKVSPSTVSRVVRNYAYVNSETRERVLDAIKQLNYIPNALARGLKNARSRLIALVITDIQSPFFTAVARGADDAAHKMGLTLVLGNSEETPSLEAEYLRVMSELRVEGLILVPSDQASSSLQNNLFTSLPVVLFDRAIPGITADVVRCDTQRGTQQLCEHLLALGHRRIAIVGGKQDISTWQERVEGYRTALSNAGLPICEDDIIPGNYRTESGNTAVQTLLDHGQLPDVIIAANAQVSLGVLNELATRGYRVPEDIGVAAIDDPMPNSAFWPRLTIVEQPGQAMGRQAVELLIARINDSTRAYQDIVFDATLRTGISCGEALPPSYQRS